jgi:lysophospholipase L1-like esterase
VLSVADGPHRLRVRPVGDGPVRLYGAALEREGPGVVVDAMGVSGRTVSSWLAWDEALQRAYLERRPPDLAVLAYGTNEANDPGMTEERYRATLRDSLARFRRVAPDAACVLIGPSDRGKKVRRGQYVIWGPTDAIARIQQEVAPDYGCLSWDLQQATGGPGSMFRWREAGLGAEDLIHFTAKGYEELATRFVAALDAAVSAPPPAGPAAAPGAPSPAAP